MGRKIWTSQYFNSRDLNFSSVIRKYMKYSNSTAIDLYIYKVNVLKLAIFSVSVPLTDVKHTVRKSRNIRGQNRSPIFRYVVLIKRIKILHGCPFEGWPNRARPSHLFWQKGLGWLCPVRSALRRTPVQEFHSFSIIFYYITSTICQKIGDLFCLFIFLDFCTVCLQLFQLYVSG